MSEAKRPAELSPHRRMKEETPADVRMEDISVTIKRENQTEEEERAEELYNQSYGHEGRGRSASTSSLAKFKAAQDLRIQTQDLPPEGKPRANSEDSSTGGASDTKTPVPPSSTGKKRRRRTAAQIDRKYPCTYPGCTKAYGSEGSLTQHQRLKHRNQTPDPQSSQTNQPMGNFFLPLHRTPRGLPGSVGRPGSSRTVSIRPAGVDALSLQPFDVAGVLVPEHDTISGDFLMASPAASLASSHGLRARSNSMPVSFASPSVLTIPYETSHSLPSDCATPSKPQSTRRSRAGTTPRTAKPPLRRQKSRSKSESLNDLAEPIRFSETIRLPLFNGRSASDTVTGIHFDPEPPYDWRQAIARANSDSPASSEDDRIDSEILSVLAGYDPSDTGDSTLEFMSSDSSEAYPTVCSLSSESEGSSLTNGTLKRLDEEWLAHHDDMYLTTHLEKMSMLHDAASPRDASENMVKGDPFSELRMVKLEFGEDDEGQVAEGAGSFQDQFPGVSIESFAITGVDPSLVAAHDSKDDLKSLVSRGPSGGSEAALFQAPAPTFKTEPFLSTASETAAAIAATSELAALATYGSCDMGQADFMDVDSGSYGPLQWKTEKPRPLPSQGLFGASLDAIPPYFHSGDKNSGLYAAREASFPMDSVDYAMEEPRLSSPVEAKRRGF